MRTALVAVAALVLSACSGGNSAPASSQSSGTISITSKSPEAISRFERGVAEHEEEPREHADVRVERVLKLPQRERREEDGDARADVHREEEVESSRFPRCLRRMRNPTIAVREHVQEEVRQESKRERSERIG